MEPTSSNSATSRSAKIRSIRVWWGKQDPTVRGPLHSEFLAMLDLVSRNDDDAAIQCIESATAIDKFEISKRQVVGEIRLKLMSDLSSLSDP